MSLVRRPYLPKEIDHVTANCRARQMAQSEGKLHNHSGARVIF